MESPPFRLKKSQIPPKWLFEKFPNSPICQGGVRTVQGVQSLIDTCFPDIADVFRKSTIFFLSK